MKCEKVKGSEYFLNALYMNPHLYILHFYFHFQKHLEMNRMKYGLIEM